MAYNRHYRRTIDAKNRVELPEAIRQVSNSSQYVITRGAETCLLLYSIEQWRDMEKELSQLNEVSREAHHFYRRVLMWATEAATDENRRIEIPSKLREVADLDQEVIILGAGTHVELWDPGRLKEYLDEKAAYAAQVKRLSG